MKTTFKIRGLRLTVDDTTTFLFPDDDDLLQVTGTFEVTRKLRNGKYANVSKRQKKKTAVSIMYRAAVHARNLIRAKENEHDSNSA